MKVSKGIFSELLLCGQAQGRIYKYKIESVWKDNRFLPGVFRRSIDGLTEWELIGYISF